MNERPQETFWATISERKELWDKYGKDYLVLKFREREEVVFVFPNRVKEERWSLLQEGETHNLIIEKNEKGVWLLVDFT